MTSNILKEIDTNGGQFTAEEHACFMKKVYGETADTKENLIRKYLSENHKNLDCLSFLIDRIKRSGYKKYSILRCRTVCSGVFF